MMKMSLVCCAAVAMMILDDDVGTDAGNCAISTVVEKKRGVIKRVT